MDPNGGQESLQADYMRRLLRARIHHSNGEYIPPSYGLREQSCLKIIFQKQESELSPQCAVTAQIWSRHFKAKLEFVKQSSRCMSLFGNFAIDYWRLFLGFEVYLRITISL